MALATYQGAAYLPEQLASIAAQDRLPDELVVGDDASCDETASVVRRFAASAPFPVRLEINARNLGSRENFSRIVARCQGEIVVLADQDDVWMPHKVRRLTEALAGDPALGFAFSDAIVVGADGRPLGHRLWNAVGLSRSERARLARGRAFEVLVRRNVVTGATMAFRAACRDLLLPVAEGWIHDGWFALLLAAVSRAAAIDEPLIAYRQHAAQQIGAKREGLCEQCRHGPRHGADEYEACAAAYAAARRRLAAFRDRLLDPGCLAVLDEKVRHCGIRAEMHRRGRRRLPTVAGEWIRGRYARFSAGWRSVARDLFFR